MSDKKLSRAVLLRLFTEGQEPVVEKALLVALDGLGWAEKAEFSKEDVMALTWRVADDARRDMAASDDPDIAGAGVALGPLLEMSRCHVAESHSAAQG